MFSSIIGLQALFDIGFSPTFARLTAYALGGRASDTFQDLRQVESFVNTGANWAVIERICATMRLLYLRLALASLFLLAPVGTLALWKPISAIGNSTFAWIAWAVIVPVSILTLLGNTYSSYLQGMNQITLLRRCETLTSLAAILTSFLVLLLNGGLLGLVVANQSWLLVAILRNRWLCRQIDNGRFQRFNQQSLEPEIFQVAWSSAWRSGLGAFMSYGLVQISGLIYAQVAATSGVAAYLLALRLIQVVSQFSQAPFYSKLPTLARLRSEGKVAQQVVVAKRGMELSYWSYVIGFIAIGLLANPLLKLIGSNAEFVSPLLWGVMGLSMFAERYGAMHIQLYSTTNHIIWHIANGISGLIYLCIILLLFQKISVYAFPVASLLSYVGFYCWYVARHTYKVFDINFWNFDLKPISIPLFIVIIYCLKSIF
ncbi:MAG: hypothetical protein HC936_01990 [Leptolyngbyaceae cyanobacterium SU_3_3]|nr:hypothetical protein [Leptolyngbyaceae cyanobacterium SU_3_3]